ncbi:SEL1-like repeat protein [Pseudomonas syringae]|uniref:Sel1 repeat family protein n=1 Tax=Pseudomonas syringae UB303 TaxID=1357287 RepID=A0AAJ4BBL5_PSESX|nr:DUF6396 domain-containing protein [Pseudomonas syringae]QHF10774.1 sel1 repeat family protein [Pseudomonas syringae UB303]SOQ04270.1 hypothetical protein CFBP4215_05043 [Pseudomonas syringae pv. syringae]
MFTRLVFLAILTASLCACEKKGHDSVTDEDMAKAMERLSFVCTHEADQLPAISADAQVLYRYALSLDLSEGAKDYQQIGRYYRLAYAAGNYKAATNLHDLIAQGVIESNSRSKEVIDIVKDLIARGIPGGYYDMGHYLDMGYGVKQDESKANAYFRRAADLGNPDAQFYVSKLLEGIEAAEATVTSMRRCAMNQGHAQAAFNYGIYMKVRGNYPEAIRGFQAGVRYGSRNSAGFLREGFSTTDASNEQYYFALPADEQRSLRYKKIGAFLRRYDALGAKVPDLDQIVPLPPAKLPDWDGTFEWLKKRESTPPDKPSEDMIRALSQEKSLDPATGMPLAAVKK